ncbi:hypothetical protein NRB_28540 [Novosphingobium sp. 11B]
MRIVVDEYDTVSGFKQVQPCTQPDDPAADNTDHPHENSIAFVGLYRIPYINRHPFVQGSMRKMLRPAVYPPAAMAPLSAFMVPLCAGMVDLGRNLPDHHAVRVQAERLQADRQSSTVYGNLLRRHRRAENRMEIHR